MTSSVEKVFSKDGSLIAFVISHNYRPASAEFITPESYNLQAGFIVYQKEGMIKRHRHRMVDRHIRGTQEVLFVKMGKLEVSLYDRDGVEVTRRVLESGDILFLFDGGHGFTMLEDTVLVEVKQGPYMGNEDKEYF